MAKLTREDVLNLARLSRLQLSEDEITQFQDEISAILGYVEILQQANVTGLEPTYQVTGLTNVTREDIIGENVSPEELLKNAPATESGQLKVGRMIE